MTNATGRVPDAGTLIMRLTAWLLFSGAAMFGFLAGCVALLDIRQVDGMARYVLPGTAATLDQRVLPVLAGCGAAMGLLGVATRLIGSSTLTTPTAQVASQSRVGPNGAQTRSRLRAAFILTAGLLLLVAAFGWRLKHRDRPAQSPLGPTSQAGPEQDGSKFRLHRAATSLA